MYRSTESEHNNAIHASRIHLMQFAVTHSLDELLEETLNEAERLTDSVIGFYYFVDDDQKSLILQNWSTRTKAEFCKAKGKCLHYSTDEAGVWVDCVYERKAVVHNDYASLPHRKGMPEGHDVVIRELVVPVSRDGKLKAILGVGNKSSDYVEEDVETISLLADIAWEIAERKLNEETLRSLNRKLLAISNCNQVLLRSTDEQTLLNDICRIICDETGYRMAWVGNAENDPAKSVRPVAWAGVEDGYLATANITWADTERGQGPTGTAIRSGEIVCIHDFSTDPKASVWRESALQRCYRSSIALPLKDEIGNTFGAMNIYSTEANTFTNKEEVRLLELLAGDLSFGINVLRARNTHKESDQRIALLSFALNNVREAAVLIDESACFQFVNDESCRLLGYTHEELLACSVPDIDPDFPVELWPDHWKHLKTSGSLTFETHHRTKDGRTFPVEINANYFVYEDQEFNLALVRDITKRKQAEQSLRLNNERMETLLQLNQMTSATMDEITSFAFEAAVRLTRSRLGYLGFINEDETVMTVQLWSREAMAECRMSGPPKVFLIETTGLWGEAIRQRRPIITNDYAAANPWKKGTPEGHVLITRHMNLPLIVDGKTVLVAGVGNKEEDYDEADVIQLTLLMEGMWRLIERKKAEDERMAHLRFLENMERINRAIQGTNDLEPMTSDVLEVVLSIFACDRAFLLYPCDLEADSWTIPVERTKPEYPGVFVLGLEMPKGPDFAETFRTLLASDGPVKFGPGTLHPLPADASERFGFESLLSMALRPKVGKPWQFGLHQCSHARNWTQKEERLFKEIGRRLEDGLTSLLAYRNLRESEAKYRQIVDTATEGICVIGLDSMITFVNARMPEMLGCSGDEMIGRPLTDFMFEEDVPDHLLKIENRRQGMSASYERRFRRKDGRTTWALTSATPIFDEGQHFNGSLAMFTDITDRKHMDHTLCESEERFRTLTEKSLVGVYIIQDDLFRYVNPAFAEIHGYTPEEIIDRLRPVELLTPEDRDRVLDSIRRRTAGEIEYSHQEFHICRKDGSIRVVEAFGSRALHHERPAVLGTIIDITERKRYEEKLFQVSERWERTFDAVPDLISILDTDFRIVQANKAMSDRLRCTSARCEGQVCYAAIHKTGAPPSFCPHAQTLRDCREHIVEVTEEGLGGDFIVSTSPILDSAGQLIGSVHVARDITERKRAELAVEESRNFLDKIINSITDPILVKDRQHRWVLLNDACCDFVGYKRDELLGKSNYEFFPKEQADVFWAKDEVVFTSGIENVNEEELTDAKGIVHTISTKKSLYIDDKGEQFIVGTIRDITERKHLENRLKGQLHFLQQLLDSIPIPVFYKDIQGFFLGCNSAFETFNDLSRSQIMGKTVYELFPKDLADTFHEADSALFSRPGIQVYETSVMHNDGECHNVIFNKATYVDADGRVAGIVGALIDITALRKAEEERKVLEAQLHQAQKMEAVGQLAGGIAHDFNNILTAIIGYSEIILMRMEKDSPFRHFVEQVLTSADRASELTNSLLAFSRRQVLNAKPIDLCGVVQGLRKMLGRIIREDIDFRTLVFEKELVVMADKGQVEQVLMNLVTNAKHAMPRGGALTIEAFPAVMSERFVHAHGFGEPGSYACISVTDTGHGMDEETRKRIFEPFFTTKEVGKGTGLGMSIIYGIIQQHNGCISVSSEMGKGTTFRIYLPRIAEEIKEVHGTLAPEAPPGGTETILLAEDEVTVRELHKMILEGAGYKIVEAVDGEDALDKFMEHMADVDILVTDVVMPKIDGKILYEKIRKIRPDMNVLFMSGYTKDIIVERGILDDEFSYITKPVKSFELLKLMRDILDRNRL
ncbi:MAG: PAS domain S-box protein [Deltaproteobacteria bacterium]|nr:PAS domain S-box protein [Deltaproteobacteria bacterium]